MAIENLEQLNKKIAEFLIKHHEELFLNIYKNQHDFINEKVISINVSDNIADNINKEITNTLAKEAISKLVEESGYKLIESRFGMKLKKGQKFKKRLFKSAANIVWNHILNKSCKSE